MQTWRCPRAACGESAGSAIEGAANCNADPSTAARPRQPLLQRTVRGPIGPGRQCPRPPPAHLRSAEQSGEGASRASIAIRSVRARRTRMPRPAQEVGHRPRGAARRTRHRETPSVPPATRAPAFDHRGRLLKTASIGSTPPVRQQPSGSTATSPNRGCVLPCSNGTCSKTGRHGFFPCGSSARSTARPLPRSRQAGNSAPVP
jgi:hypothetical protein